MCALRCLFSDTHNYKKQTSHIISRTISTPYFTPFGKTTPDAVGICT